MRAAADFPNEHPYKPGNREQWLERAVEMLAPLVEAETGEPFTHPRVSVGFGPAKPRSAIGWCTPGTVTDDETPQVFISPCLKPEDAAVSENGILATLLHELCHAALPPTAHHGPKFARLAEAVGLDGPWTMTSASKDLVPTLEDIYKALGEFPHSAITFGKEKKKQTTRMIKCMCPDTEYQCRTTKKWLDQMGAPICPCCKEVMEVEKDDE